VTVQNNMLNTKLRRMLSYYTRCRCFVFSSLYLDRLYGL